jgi:hypothetical protein
LYGWSCFEKHWLVEGNDLRWLNQVDEIVLKCETVLIDNFGLSIIGETLSKFHQKFEWNFTYTFVFLKKKLLVNLPDNN